MLFLASHKDITANKVIHTTANNTLQVPGFEFDDEELEDDEYLEDNGVYDGHMAGGAAGRHLGPEAPSNYNYGRRRSRAVLYQLSGHYKTNDNAAKKIHAKLGGANLVSLLCACSVLKKNRDPYNMIHILCSRYFLN